MLDDKAKAELEALNNRPVDTSDEDAPEIENWDDAVVGKFYRPIKKTVTIRLDADVLAWFKSKNTKYQTAVNKVLREYMQEHSH